MSKPIYKRTEATEPEIVLDWEGGMSWVPHPDEMGKRCSHAIQTDDGVWLIDPMDAPTIDDQIQSLGTVSGVAVCSRYHARDADSFADRYDVSVSLPEWMDRVEPRLNTSPVRYTGSFHDEFRVFPCRPLPIWKELFCYHEPTATLVIPDSLATVYPWTRETEQLGLDLNRRLQPPTQLAELEPDRILVGHGEPVTENAAEVLQTALSGARRSFPGALVETGPPTVKKIIEAFNE